MLADDRTQQVFGILSHNERYGYSRRRVSIELFTEQWLLTGTELDVLWLEDSCIGWRRCVAPWLVQKIPPHISVGERTSSVRASKQYFRYSASSITSMNYSFFFLSLYRKYLLYWFLELSTDRFFFLCPLVKILRDLRICRTSAHLSARIRTFSQSSRETFPDAIRW